jgi:CTP synthase (UTP-ammonia lyase)
LGHYPSSLLQEKGFRGMKPKRIALLGDYNPQVIAHRAIPQALKLAAASAGTPVDAVWVETAILGSDVPHQLADCDAIWCVPASPYANTEGALAAIRFARESGRPFLGTCGGFQHALLEYVRNVLGLREAQHAETCADAEMPLIAPLSCALVEKAGTIAFMEGSRLRHVYGATEARETYRCNYGLNPRYEKLFQDGVMRICGRDQAGEVRAVELHGHPFFVATLYQPERAALHGTAHPLVNAFVAAAASV